MCISLPTMASENKSKIVTPPICNFFPNTPMPGWVMEPVASDNDYLYGYGVASTPHDNLRELRVTSRNEARRDLSESLQVRIKSEINVKTFATENNENRKISSEAKNFIASESDAVLVSSEVVQLWLQPNSCNLWTKIKISKLKVKTSEAQISNSVVDSINKNLQNMMIKLEGVKKETSDDPRKELANRGISFSPQSFAQQLYLGNEDNIALFLKTGMTYEDAEDPNGEKFEEYFYRISVDRLSNSLKALSAHAANIDLSYPLLRAIHFGDIEKTKLLIQYGANPNQVDTRLFHSYVWRMIELDNATPLCFAKARVAYFKQYPDKNYSIDKLLENEQYLVGMNLESQGKIITKSGMNERRYNTGFNCKANTQYSIK